MTMIAAFAAGISRTLLCLLTLAPATLFAADAGSIYALPYALADESGAARTLAHWRGRATVVAMDHSTWGAVCSSTARRLRAVQVAADRLGQPVEFVIIGLEPEKDSPESWAAYRKDREVTGPNWHFLRASPEDTPRIAADLGVRYRYEYGDLVHDLRILRVDAEGRIVRLIEGYDTDTEAFLR